MLKSHNICLHSFLVLAAGLNSENVKNQTNANHEFDRRTTVDLLVDLIIEHLPTATTDSSSFLKANKNFMDQLLKKKDLNAELSKYSFSECPKCSDKLKTWPHKTKESFLVSLGDIKKVKVNVNQCQKCNILLYPNLYNVGLIPLHNKADFYNI